MSDFQVVLSIAALCFFGVGFVIIMAYSVIGIIEAVIELCKLYWGKNNVEK